MPFEPANAPPVGFRKAIPLSVKLTVVVAQDALCTTCKEPLRNLANVEFDHVPALQLRLWCEEVKDTVPAANDPAAIEAKHADCHAAKTFGGKATKRGGDITEIARTRRLTEQQQEFRRRILSKGEEDAPVSTKPKSRWPTRPFRTGGPHGQEDTRRQARRRRDDAPARHH
ncbi:MAG: uncharacterized protein JWM36_1129 [Hyphomicrobiales bacterium]|nr:uncharacterized protein [Hyphomicrobiales bacterium]